MMRVSGWPTEQEAERRASYYRARGYRVSIMVMRDPVTKAQKSDFWLECKYLPN